MKIAPIALALTTLAATPAAAIPAGQELVPVSPSELQQRVATMTSRAVLVNVWATWCLPCREEFPDLVALDREFPDRDFDVVFVSADFDSDLDAAREFLRDHGITGRSYLKTGADAEFIDSLSPEWSGALPGSFLYDGAGRLCWFHQGRVDMAELRAQVDALLHESDTGTDGAHSPRRIQ